MAKERGLLTAVFKSFVASFKPRTNKVKLVGTDYNGTKYFEDPEARWQRGRSFQPIDKEDFEQELPAEWEAWLRYRRREPPSDDEVNANYQLMLLKKKNAAELEKKYAEEKGITLDVPKEKTGYESFPAYEEYKHYGHDYRDEIDKNLKKKDPQ